MWSASDRQLQKLCPVNVQAATFPRSRWPLWPQQHWSQGSQGHFVTRRVIHNEHYGTRRQWCHKTCQSPLKLSSHLVTVGEGVIWKSKCILGIKSVLPSNGPDRDLDSETQRADPSRALQSLHRWFGRSLGDPQALFRPFAQRSFSQWTNVEPVVFMNCSFLIQFISQQNDFRKSVHAELQLLFFNVTLK